MYVVNYDIQDTGRLKAFMEEARKFGEVEQHVPNAFFIKGASQSCDDMSAALKKVLIDEDLFFVAKVNINEMAGWLHTNTVNWLKKE